MLGYDSTNPGALRALALRALAPRPRPSALRALASGPGPPPSALRALAPRPRPSGPLATPGPPFHTPRPLEGYRVGLPRNSGGFVKGRR